MKKVTGVFTKFHSMNGTGYEKDKEETFEKSVAEALKSKGVFKFKEEPTKQKGNK